MATTKFNISLGAKLSTKSLQEQLKLLANKYTLKLSVKLDIAGIKKQLSDAGIGTLSMKDVGTGAGSRVGTDSLARAQLQQDKYNLAVSKTNKTLQKANLLEDDRKRLLSEIESITKDESTNLTTKNQQLSVTRQKIADVNIEQQKTKQGLIDISKKFLTWYVLAGVLTSMVKALKDVVNITIQLDTQMTRIQMLTQGSKKATAELRDEYIQMARDLGATTDQVLDAADAWLRTGLSVEETSKAIKAATMLSVIANEDATTSAENLIAVMNAYKLTANELIEVVDKWSLVDAISATSSQELGEAFSKTASSAELVGVTIDKLTGILATASSVTRQSGSTIGQAYKTIFARLSSYKSGETEDTEGESISNVSEVLAKYNINLMETSNNLNDLGALLDLLGTKWQSYTTAQKSEIAEAIAGVRQKNILIATLENYDQVLELEEEALNSAGSAQEKYNMYLDSTQAKINQLKDAFANLATKTIDSGIVNFFIELLTGITDLSAKTGGLINSIALLSGGFLVIRSSIRLYTIQTNAAKAATLGFSSAVSTLQLAIGSLLAVFGIITAIISAVKSAQEEREAQLDASISKVKEDISATESLADKYYDIIKVTDDVANRNEKLASSYDELAKMAKQYGVSIEGNSVTLENYLKTLNETELAEQRRYKALYGEKYKKAQEFLSTPISRYGSSYYGSYPGLETPTKEAVTPEEMVTFLENRISELESWDRLGKADENVLANAREDLANLLSEIEKNQQIINEFEQATKDIDFLEEWGVQFKELREQFELWSAGTKSEMAETANSMEESIVNFVGKVKEALPEYSEEIENLTKSWLKQTKAAREYDLLLDDIDKRRAELKKQIAAEEEELKIQEKLLAVEKARAELAEARNKKVRVFRAGQGFVYESDQSEVEKAQQNLQSALTSAYGTPTEQLLKRLEEVAASYEKAQAGQAASGLTNLRDYFNIEANREAFMSADFETQMAILESLLSEEKTTTTGSLSPQKFDTSGLGSKTSKDPLNSLEMSNKINSLFDNIKDKVKNSIVNNIQKLEIIEPNNFDGLVSQFCSKLGLPKILKKE